MGRERILTWTAKVGSVLALAACAPPAPSDTPPGEPIPPADAPPGSPPALGAITAGPINAVGTEPFWAAEIRPDHLKLSGPDRGDLLAPNPGPRAEGETTVWTSRSTDGAPFKVTLLAEACSDGMSDLAYPYRAKIETAGEVLAGCAAPVDAWPKRPDSARGAR